MLVLAIFVSNTIYGLASPFLPNVFEDKDIESVWTGVIFAAFAIASTFSSLFIGKVLDSVGHRNVIVFGSMQMAASMSLFGLVKDL